MGLFRNAFRVYLSNLRISFWFAILLVFTAVFPLFSNMIYSSGTIFLEYTFNVEQTDLILQMLGIVFYLLFYSFFLSLIVFGVRKELSAVRIQYYFKELLHKITFKMFAFFVLFVLFLMLISFGLVALNVPLWAITLLLLVLSLPVIFIPQVIVVEELPIFEALAESIDFTRKHLKFTAMILVLGSLLLAVLLVLEYAIDILFPGLFVGRIVTLLLSLVFVVPFLEALKTYFYMMKFGILKSIEELHGR